MWNSLIESRHPGVFDGLDLNSLKVDESFLKITSVTDQNVNIYQRSSLCHKCPFVHYSELLAGESINKTFNSNQYWHFLITTLQQKYISKPQSPANFICYLGDVQFGEFGVYELNVAFQNCTLETVKDPVFKYAALFLVFGVLFVCFLFYLLFDYLLNRKWKKKLEDEENLSEIEIDEANLTVRDKPRIKSLDTFRGLTIVMLMLVSYGGGGFWFLSESTWDGLTGADIVFPWFMWIMGVCIPFSINSRFKNSISRCKILLDILNRSIKLFVLGIILSSLGGDTEITTLRIPGVLQRFAFGYWICASIYCLTYFSRSSSDKETQVKKFLSIFDDVISLLPQWVFHCILTGGYLAIVFLLPVPGCPTGYLGPGGLLLLEENVPNGMCVGGATGFVDRFLLGSKHLFQSPTPAMIYGSSAFDPEGILGIVPTALQVFLGVQAGQVMVSHGTHKGRLIRWAFWTVVYAIIGLGLSGGTLTGYPIPVNKNLWSLSFVFVTSSLALFGLLLCYLLIDCFQIVSGAPFYQTGMNSIFLFVGSYFTTRNVFPWKFSYYGEFDTHIGMSFETMWATLLWVLIAVYMHWRKIFIII